MSSAGYEPTDLGADIAATGLPLATIVGGDTALTTRDGDSSYVDLLTQSPTIVTYRDAITFRLTPVGAGVPPGATVDRLLLDIEYRKGPASTNTVAAFDMLLFGGLNAYVGSTTSTSYTYEEGVVIADRATGNAFHLAALDAVRDGTGFWWIFPMDPAVTYDLQARITYLRVWAEYGAPVLRQRNRGRVRARNHASRQDSIRQRGFL